MKRFGLKLIGIAAAASVACAAGSQAFAAEAKCPEADTGITLPKGFCASVFADKVGHARQMAVAPDGTLYVNTWSGV
jgi:glucose/arabinose dehydrogenase